MSRKKIVAATVSLAAFGLGFAGFLYAMRANSNGQQAPSGDSSRLAYNAYRMNHPVGRGDVEITAPDFHLSESGSVSSPTFDVDDSSSTEESASTGAEPEVGQCFDIAEQGQHREFAGGGDAGSHDGPRTASSAADSYAGSSWGGGRIGSGKFSGGGGGGGGGSRRSGGSSPDKPGNSQSGSAGDISHVIPQIASVSEETEDDEEGDDTTTDLPNVPNVPTEHVLANPDDGDKGGSAQPPDETTPQPPKKETDETTVIINPPPPKPEKEEPVVIPPLLVPDDSGIPPGEAQQVYDVPEPGTLGLVALGFAALGLRRRRKEAAQQ